MSLPLQIIMIDNFDSFTYNLVDQFRQLNAQVVVFRNETPIETIFTSERLAGKKNLIVISPGPGNPDSAGNSLNIIKQFAGKFPILGICLGQQAIVQAFGGTVSHAKQIVHGKADIIYPRKHFVFNNMGESFRAARYHSLVVTKLPKVLNLIANSKDDIMGVEHQQHKILGFQFHPESILTTQGNQLLKDSITWLTDDL